MRRTAWIGWGMHLEDMALAIVVWMCTVPLVLLLGLPLIGLRLSLVLAIGLLVVVLVICRSLCSSKMLHP